MSELPGLDARIGYVYGDGADSPSLESMLAQVAAQKTQEDAGGPTQPGPAAIVVPLLACPDGALLRRTRQAVANGRSGATLADVLGPHPVLAEALHVRLSEAGLARADRARLFDAAQPADGIILATIGGEEAVQSAGITGMLLSARLAVPVLVARLDKEGAISRAAKQLRGSGSQQLVLTPYLVGPYSAVARLLLSHYTAAIGITQQQSQGVPVR
ncbi:hypothetical protein [Streptomyces goshikiensis]|uniref:hypothetical protein n=1 Tax=Streptomyces goshikiensis TaxID=1942 RepID=UPI00365A2227